MSTFSRRPLRALTLLAGGALVAMCLPGLPLGGQEAVVPRIGPSKAGGAGETLSSSGQFLAHGTEQRDRAVLVSRAEEIRDEWQALVEREEKAIDPTTFAELARDKPLVIDLWLQGDARPPVQPRLYRMEGLPQPTMGLIVARAELADGPEFRREIIRLLLVERQVSAHPEADLTGRAEVVPPWLSTGVIEALDWRRAGQPSRRFAHLFGAGRILPVEDVLATSPDALDSAGRDVFAASACSLVLALLDQPQGPTRFRRFLGERAVREESDQMQLIRTFPGLALSKHSLEKWWSLQMAAMAQPNAFEALGAAETDAQLTQALLVHYRPVPPRAGTSGVSRLIRRLLPGGASAAAPAAPAASAAEEIIPLTDLQRLRSLPQPGQVLSPTRTALAELALRAFPLHRPLLDEYQQVVGLLGRGKTKGLAARLEDLAARRREILRIAAATEDYLNWYEATQPTRVSGTFDPYFKLLDDLARPPRPSDDPISLYLDSIEAEFAKGTEE